MPPENTPNLQITRLNEVFEPHPELLMAARRGDWGRLQRLLSKDEDAAARDVVIHVEEPVAVVVEVSAAEAVNVARDSVLHVVASRGDGDEFVTSATVIYGRACHLLQAQNGNGDTPLHCAARAGWGKMVTHLVALARKAGNGDGGDDEKVKTMLRVQNKLGETVLHEAVRLRDGDMVDRLMSEDSELARFPPADGASPLYLAVSLGHDDIARQLYEKDQALSYSGPDGRNALHAAALRGEGE